MTPVQKPAARLVLWLQQQRLNALYGALLEGNIEAVASKGVSWELLLDLSVVNALLPALQPLDGQPLPHSTVWQAFGAERSLGLSGSAGLPPAWFAGKVTACECDYALDRSPPLRVLGKGKPVARVAHADGADVAVLRLGQNLLALTVSSSVARSRRVLTLQAEAHVESWVEGADPGSWVRLQNVDAVVDGRYKVLSSVRRCDLSQGFHTILRLQRTTT